MPIRGLVSRSMDLDRESESVMSAPDGLARPAGRALPDFSHVGDGDVPPDRPHLRHWPARLPRTLVLPATSLWFNLEVAATRFPDKPATLYFGRARTFSALRRD